MKFLNQRNQKIGKRLIRDQDTGFICQKRSGTAVFSPSYTGRSEFGHSTNIYGTFMKFLNKWNQKLGKRLISDQDTRIGCQQGSDTAEFSPPDRARSISVTPPIFKESLWNSWTNKIIKTENLLPGTKLWALIVVRGPIQQFSVTRYLYDNQSPYLGPWQLVFRFYDFIRSGIS